MVSRNITIDSLLGIHLRPAGAMCEEAVKYKSTVTFGYGEGKSANGKSIISILASGVKCGETINLRADGEDEKEALAEAPKGWFPLPFFLPEADAF